MVKIKICGLSCLRDIDAVNEERPEYVGFVFAPSRRNVTPQEALGLRKRLRPDIVPVGVFVDETVETMVSIVRDGIVDIVQLHGVQNENFVSHLKTQIHKPVIKAIAVEHDGDVQKWADTSADYLLFDRQGGGSGLCFDWNLIGKVEKSYFLAGGLHANNVTEAIQKTRPFAVDVSGGVETNGSKDHAKIKEFIMRARDAGNKAGH
ncbi:MAG: phosphoribosylanthranilate isomerase [Polyangiaceae bacterium]|nr:phosphoribosylanthranilate isomerase [Polyangiaceae bacterium]